MASTTTQSMNPKMPMRSVTPTHGVGRFAATRGSPKPAKAPNTMTARIVGVEVEPLKRM